MNIGIIGLGLIGGSLGLDLRAQGNYIWGISRNQSTCDRAVALGVVDVASCELPEIPQIDRTDVVFICTPIAAILPAIASLTPHLSSHTIITDVGSVKAAIAAQAQSLWAKFVGGHPMAGTAFSGIEAAERNLFQRRACVLTPSRDHDSLASVEIVRSLWQSVGAVVYECTPEAHDRAVAWISHLPVMISASLLLACQQEGNPEILQLAQQLASSGFRDTSRVGGGNPELGVMMAEYNQAALLETLHTYQKVLQDLISQIETGKWQEIQATLAIAQQLRPFYVCDR
jgi:arogenate dehydrogenase (NADP+)